MKFLGDIYGSKRMKPNVFHDPLTLPQVPTAGQNVALSLIIS